jgi:hypothetical protein
VSEMPLDEDVTSDANCPIFMVTAEEMVASYSAVEAFRCHLLSDQSTLTLPYLRDWTGRVDGSADRSFRFKRIPKKWGISSPTYSARDITTLLEATVDLCMYVETSPKDSPFLIGPPLDQSVSVHEVDVEMLLPDVSEAPDVQAAIYHRGLAHNECKKTLFWRRTREERESASFLRRYMRNGKRIRFSSGMILPMKLMWDCSPVTCAVCLQNEIPSGGSRDRQSFRATIYAYGNIESIPPKTILKRELAIEARGKTHHLSTDMCVVV